MTVYAIGSTNDDLLRELRDPDPNKRASAAEALGVLHDYLALPHLLTAAKTDADGRVREAARLAIRALLPSQEAADRAIGGQSPIGCDAQPGAQVRSDAAAAVIDAFRAYVRARRVRDGSGFAGKDLRAVVVGYLGAWGGESVEDLDEVGLAAALAIGAIARHIEIPPQHAGAKWMSYRDANERVETYDAARAREFRAANDAESES